MKLDEMVDTFSSIVTPHIGTREALAAVLRKHIEPMIAEAFSRGIVRGKYGPNALTPFEYGNQHAKSIITAIVEK